MGNKTIYKWNQSKVGSGVVNITGTRDLSGVHPKETTHGPLFKSRIQGHNTHHRPIIPWVNIETRIRLARKVNELCQMGNSA